MSRRSREGSREAATAPVAVAVVSHDSAADLPGCLEAVARLEPTPREVVLVDSGSRDGSPEVARRWRREVARGRALPLEVIPLPDNRGFAASMNRALAATGAPHVLSLNPDARPVPDYLERLLERMVGHPELQVGAVTGRLVRPPGESGERRLDACGMRLTASWRHLDRGSGEIDDGRFLEPERVFGATGAASLFRRQALQDVAVDGEIFDPRFHSFREDAELAFRLRERGWEVLYEPAAHCEHRRYNLPERRSAMPPEVNRHSLKNRYLLRIYHQTGGNFLRTLIPTLGRDLLALGWVLLRERSSLPAFAWLWRHRRELLARRRVLQARRTVPPAELERWFRVQGLELGPPRRQAPEPAGSETAEPKAWTGRGKQP